MDSIDILRGACKTLGLRPGMDLEPDRFGEIIDNIRRGGIRRLFDATLLLYGLIHGIPSGGISKQNNIIIFDRDSA